MKYTTLLTSMIFAAGLSGCSAKNMDTKTSGNTSAYESLSKEAMIERFNDVCSIIQKEHDLRDYVVDENKNKATIYSVFSPTESTSSIACIYSLEKELEGIGLTYGNPEKPPVTAAYDMDLNGSIDTMVILTPDMPFPIYLEPNQLGWDLDEEVDKKVYSELGKFLLSKSN